jgi:hypothetical protein
MTLSALGMGLLRPAVTPPHDGFSFNFLNQRFVTKPIGGAPTIHAGAGSALTIVTPQKWLRNANGVLVSVAANQPPYEFGVGGGAKGIRLEAAATNVALHSQDVSNAQWQKSGLRAFGSGSTVDAGVAPDGSTTADLITVDTGTSTHGALQFLSANAADIWTWSVFAKRPPGTALKGLELAAYYWTQATYHSAFFDLEAGTAGSVTAGSSSRIEPLANGWFRCEFSVSTTISQSMQLIANASLNGSSNFFAGDGTSGLLLWGGQLERGAASSYIPTTTATVTRAGDSVVRTPGANEAPQAEGSVIVEVEMAGVLGAGNGLIERGGGNGQMLYQQGSVRVSSWDGTQISAAPDSAVSRFQPYRAGLSWGGGPANRFVASNIGAVRTGSGSFANTFTGDIRLGTTNSGALPLNGWMRSVDWYPTRLSDAQLQSMVA